MGLSAVWPWAVLAATARAAAIGRSCRGMLGMVLSPGKGVSGAASRRRTALLRGSGEESGGCARAMCALRMGWSAGAGAPADSDRCGSGARHGDGSVAGRAERPERGARADVAETGEPRARSRRVTGASAGARTRPARVQISPHAAARRHAALHLAVRGEAELLREPSRTRATLSRGAVANAGVGHSSDRSHGTAELYQRSAASNTRRPCLRPSGTRARTRCASRRRSPCPGRRCRTRCRGRAW